MALVTSVPECHPAQRSHAQDPSEYPGDHAAPDARRGTQRPWPSGFQPLQPAQLLDGTLDVASLRGPQPDSARVKKPEWLVLVGVCTHLGCVPLGQRSGDDRGEFGGWFCPCHGSAYDTSGRIRRGPAPENLHVPPYAFLTDTTIRIG